MSDRDGGLVFPNPAIGIQEFGRIDAYPGLTLRDYFAAHAIIGWRDSPRLSSEDDAKEAYLVADAMIKARETT
jgi:hypothetical protein